MIDMTTTIVPKSDQLNSDDLLSGPRTITITGVRATGEGEQPIAVAFEGDAGKPYKPCKSMRRVMVAVWGPDASQYIGRGMTLYRDPAVTWGGMEVGGIRISNMSDMDAPVVLALTATKKARKPYRVLPLVAAATPDRATTIANDLRAQADAIEDATTLAALLANETATKQRDWLREKRPELSLDVEAAVMAAEKRVGVPA